jgi:hypothetical protein
MNGMTLRSDDDQVMWSLTDKASAIVVNVCCKKSRCPDIDRV